MTIQNTEVDYTGQNQFKFQLNSYKAKKSCSCLVLLKSLFLLTSDSFSLISALLIWVSLATAMFHIPGSSQKKFDVTLQKMELTQS